MVLSRMHGLHVTVSLSTLSKRLVTHTTFVWFLSRMDSHMGVSTSRESKRLVTQVTLEWFFPSVNCAVLFKLSALFATNTACKQFFVAVVFMFITIM